MLRPHIDSLIGWYKRSFFLLFHFLLAVLLAWVLLNGVLALTFRIWDGYFKMHNPIVQKYGGVVQQAYPGWSQADLDVLLKESWTRTFESDFFLMLKERPFQGRYVNVDPHGFRRSLDQGPWPPDPRNLNVFFFGGSTGFGYGVRDEETVASGLAQILNASGKSKRPVKVYNFGRAGYYSTPERLLFERLLVEGYVPDAAVFMDGLNEFERANDDWSEFGHQVDTWVYNPAVALGHDLMRLLIAQPVLRVQNSLRTGYLGFRLRGNKPAPPGSSLSVEQTKSVIERYKRNHQLITAAAQVNRVRCVFAWQPIPFYKFDLRRNHMSELNPGRQAGVGYTIAEREIKGHMPANFIWLADLQEHITEDPLYVDSVHYSALMSRKVAEAIASAVVLR